MTILVLLRTLTPKSMIMFGKFKDLTVQELLNMQKIRYLRWMYFFNSKINFTPEVLELLSITEVYIINKPGIDEEKYDALNEYQLSKICGLNKLKHEKHMRKIKRLTTERKAYNLDTNVMTKRKLQNYNHGRRRQ